MAHTECRICSSSKQKLLIDLGMQPVAHDLLRSPDQVDRISHPLALHQCQDCSFIQINDPIDPALLYTEYNFCFSSWKPQPHIQDEIEILHRHATGAKCIEIGCNDGVFLKPLRQAGFAEVVGLEPNPYAAAKAREVGFPIVEKMLTPATAQVIRNEFGTFDLLIARQVIEHIPNLHTLFKSVNLLLNESGYVFFEVPDFGEALRTADCSTIWEEHTNYFTLITLRHLLARHGFALLHEKSYDFSGGALSVLARSSFPHLLHYRTNTKLTSFGSDFAQRVGEVRLRVRRFLSAARNEGKQTAIYGSGVRACTFVNGLGLKELLDVAIDDQPEKQTLFMPGARLPIVSLAYAVDSGKEWVFLLAVNHENEATVKLKIEQSLGDRAKAYSFFAPHDVMRLLDDLV